MYITVQADIQEAADLLDGFDKERPKILKNLLRTSGQKTRSKVKKSYNSYLHRQTGDLYRTIRYYMYRNGRAAVVTAHRKDDKVRYGFMLAHGYDIKPKGDKPLTYQINGAWKRSWGHHVNARDFIEEPGNRYLNSSEYDSDLEKKMEKEVARIEKKYEKMGQIKEISR